MRDRSKLLSEVGEPDDYFRGVGHRALPWPGSILLFVRTTQQKLQQEALQNRSHHRYVLILNLRTPGTVHVDHLALALAPGQALLIHPYQFHHFSRLATPGLEWLFCTFELESNTWLEPLRNRVLDVQADASDAVDLLLRDWKACSTVAPSMEMRSACLQTALVRVLLSLLREQQASVAGAAVGPADNLISAVSRIMAERRGRPVAIADVADALDMSTSRLRARFRASAGVPLGGYLRNYRITRAMSLLRTTDLPVAEVAEEAGFGSPEAFSRVFKQKTGHTPRRYRHGR